MSATYTIFADLAQEATPPASGILSRTLYADDRLKVVLFGFATGEELSEHTAAVPAIIQMIRGDATVSLGADRHEATAGSWVHMPAKMPHSIYAKTPLVMLLLLLK